MNSQDIKIENYSFSNNLDSEEKRLFNSFGRKSKICTPFEAINPQCMRIGDYVSINRDFRIAAYKNFTHHIDFLRQHYPEHANRVKIDDYIFKAPNIVIGDCTSFGRFGFITATNEVKIGKAVIISDRCYISDSMHRYEDLNIPIIFQSMTKGGVVEIGDHGWVGVGVTILNCKIGKHCVIGAHSVVINDIPDYSIAVGTPARVIEKYSLKRKRWEKIQPNEER